MLKMLEPLLWIEVPETQLNQDEATGLLAALVLVNLSLLVPNIAL